MFKRITEFIVKSYRQETLGERSKRMLPGAMYGAMAATAYVFVFSVINLIFFPDLPFAVDWTGLLTRWVGFGLGLAIAGMIVGWFTEDYMGIVGGGIVLTILLLVGNLVASMLGGGSVSLTVQSFFTAIPLVGVCIILAWAIRVAINRHLHIRQMAPLRIRRNLFFQLAIIVILVGLIPGVFSRFDVSAEYAIRTVNEGLQKGATDPLLEMRFPLTRVPALKEHFGRKYDLIARASVVMTGALDVTIRFEDGYTITCLVPTESGDAMFLQFCNEGRKVIIP